jgi:hypothetical protein
MIPYHIPSEHDNAKHMIYRNVSYALLCIVLWDCSLPSNMSYVFFCLSYVFYALFCIRVAFPHPMCHMFYIVMPIADLLGYFCMCPTFYFDLSILIWKNSTDQRMNRTNWKHITLKKEHSLVIHDTIKNIKHGMKKAIRMDKTK